MTRLELTYNHLLIADLTFRKLDLASVRRESLHDYWDGQGFYITEGTIEDILYYRVYTTFFRQEYSRYHIHIGLYLHAILICKHIVLVCT